MVFWWLWWRRWLLRRTFSAVVTLVHVSSLSEFAMAGKCVRLPPSLWTFILYIDFKSRASHVTFFYLRVEGAVLFDLLAFHNVTLTPHIITFHTHISLEVGYSSFNLSTCQQDISHQHSKCEARSWGLNLVLVPRWCAWASSRDRRVLAIPLCPPLFMAYIWRI